MMTINKVTVDGIYYRNDLGCDTFLSFIDCNKNWLAYRKQTESLNDSQVKSLSEKDKTVGQRNVDSGKIFIEFFIRPFVRFEFILPEQKIEYETLRDSIWNCGWSTNDLS